MTEVDSQVIRVTLIIISIAGKYTGPINFLMKLLVRN